MRRGLGRERAAVGARRHPVDRFLNDVLIPYEDDEVTRLIIDATTRGEASRT